MPFRPWRRCCWDAIANDDRGRQGTTIRQYEACRPWSPSCATYLRTFTTYTTSRASFFCLFSPPPRPPCVISRPLTNLGVLFLFEKIPASQPTLPLSERTRLVYRFLFRGGEIKSATDRERSLPPGAPFHYIRVCQQEYLCLHLAGQTSHSSSAIVESRDPFGRKTEVARGD